MDILNFISWIKGGNYRATLPTDVPSLLPIGAKDPSRDDGYLPLAVNAAPLQTLYNSGNVTQTPLINSGVTVNGLNGIITTVSSTLAANAKTSFTVNIIDGKFGILLANGGNAALDAVVKIHYLVIV